MQPKPREKTDERECESRKQSGDEKNEPEKGGQAKSMQRQCTAMARQKRTSNRTEQNRAVQEHSHRAMAIAHTLIAYTH